ncbi:unnamed protein product [Strongylus vulgaris]|uniref:Uncharacterized protein n=1 Tax=Strongylus vulgaris TaxID=40348 RepID=A0A3P7JJ64_STRVU|nr:unnamed protein product [Strongylus vulgaris]
MMEVGWLHLRSDGSRVQQIVHAIIVGVSTTSHACSCLLVVWRAACPCRYVSIPSSACLVLSVARVLLNPAGCTLTALSPAALDILCTACEYWSHFKV